ncbi:hypothetical protein JRO89_XS08G0130300 [Xanthoceras sorbifolium]|uniref:Fe2OG dioxygenase domain-containing protein n=1 Tax=Xanthoceras sorbifolium TaxID=99658 RepID=A0ABQ8HPQ4_9ROSI|nr:hypothetical protein JRO89_XS08G0130300 [Xanthoceras sorbifolium]
MNKNNDLNQVRTDDPFLLRYQPADLRIASEFLTTWLPFLCRDLCHSCRQNLSNRVRSLDSVLDGGGESESLNIDENRDSSSPNNVESLDDDNCDANSLGSWKDAGEINSFASSKDVTNRWCENDVRKASTSGGGGGLTFESSSVEKRNHRMSWADMAQEDELEKDEEEEEEQQQELNKWTGDFDVLRGESRVSKVREKPQFSREEREYMRFMNVKREKDFMCFEKIKGKLVNILAGLELHADVFSAAEQKRIVDYVYVLQGMGERGELKAESNVNACDDAPHLEYVVAREPAKKGFGGRKVVIKTAGVSDLGKTNVNAEGDDFCLSEIYAERTYTAPQKWMKGKGRVTIQFGCCYNYATDKDRNPPGILQNKTVDPIPHLFKVMIRRLVKWHVLPSTCVPDSCIVNIYEEGDCIPPHIDNHDFLRPFCTVSFLSQCNIVFGSNLKVVGAGEFAGPIGIPLPVGSVLVLNGNAADVAKHCVPAVPSKRISITFRKMDESKRPIGFVPEPDLQGIESLSYDLDKTKLLSHTKRQPFRRDDKTEAREPSMRNDTHAEPHYSSRFRRGPINKRRTMVNPGS